MIKQQFIIIFLISNLTCIAQDLKTTNNNNVLDGIYVHDYDYSKRKRPKRYFTEPDTNMYNGPYSPSKNVLISKSKWMKCLYYTHEKAYYFTFKNEYSTLSFDTDYFWLSETEFNEVYNSIYQSINKENNDKHINLQLQYSFFLLKYNNKKVSFYCFNKRKSYIAYTMEFDIDDIKRIFSK
jgi:hypothetical protein